MTHSLIFFGSDQYSEIVLNQLMVNGQWSMVNIVTDKQKESTPVEKLAKKYNLKVAYYPTNADEMNKFNVLMVKWCNGVIPFGLCASFDHLIPQDIIEKFDGHLYNLHPSLLPQYRNVSPVQYAIALGDTETGITLFRIAPSIDNGEIIAKASEPILPDDTTPTLTTRLFAQGAQLFLESLQNDFRTLRLYDFTDKKDLIFTRRLTRNSGFIEWPTLHKLLQNQLVSPKDTKNELLKLQKTPSLDHLLRALTPWPGVWSLVPTKKADLRLRLVEASAKTGSPSFLIHLAGKPKPILYNDFIKYYLGK